MCFMCFIFKGVRFCCRIGNRYLKCLHQGQADVEKHLKSKEHEKSLKSVKMSSKIRFTQENHPLKEVVQKAKIKTATFLPEDNISITFPGKFSPVINDVFTDSKIVKEYISKRTITACIIKDVEV